MTWLVLANAGFMAGGVLLYAVGRKRLLRSPATHRRSVELGACLLVSALAAAGFALAHIGMNQSLSGRAGVTDLRWLGYALAFAGALLLAHVLLRRIAAQADELMLPVAAFLALLGLVNVYAWETRDANAYVSTAALPALRAERSAIAESRTLGQDEKKRLLRALGAVPNELEYERRAGRRATVLDAGWLDEYNAAVRRFERGTVRPPGVHAVAVGDGTVRQLAAAALGLLLVPLVLLAARRAPPAFGRSRLPILLAAALPLALLAAAIATAGGGRLPPLLPLGSLRLTVFELVKVGLVVLIALTLASRRGAAQATSARLAPMAAVATVGLMLWRDAGAGLMLVALAAAMTILVAGRVLRSTIVVAGVVAVALAPAATELLGSGLPQTVRVRLEMWGNPWGSYEEATLQNEVSRALGRVAEFRRNGHGPDRNRRLNARTVGPVGIGNDASRIEQELRWRLASRRSGTSGGAPLVPEDHPGEELLLLQAETLWAELGGFRSTASTPAFSARADGAIARLRATAERLDSGGTGDGGTGLTLAADDFQLQRSLYALREGGAFGVGLGQGRPEAIPGLTEDLPLVGIGEASGLLGVVLVALLVLLLAGRGLDLARQQRRPFAALLVCGLAALLGLQAVIRIGGLTSMVPFTGLTFPFLSRGGTGLVSNFLLVALLLAVSDRTAERSVGTEGGPRRHLRLAGLPAAFALVVGNVALLQLTGRTVAPGPVLAALPAAGSVSLHASNQWEQPEYGLIPGPILDRNDAVLAQTSSVRATRDYPQRKTSSSLSHTLLQLDLSFHDRLLGRTKRSGRVGPTLVTTIDSAVQRAVDEAFQQGAAEAGLADVEHLRGAIAVVDVRNGGIVALLSRPAFSLDEITDPMAWARAEAVERRKGFAYRHLNRVVQGFYPPGSIFKTVTAAGALERGFHTLHSRDFDYDHGPEGRRRADRIDELGPWHQLALPDGPPITDGNHPQLESWVFDLASAYTWSCNVAFAQMGLELGPVDLVGFARRFGLERPLVVEGLGTSTSTLDNDWTKPVGERYLARSVSNLARTAFGQGQARATPLQMALLPAAIANHGTIMQPHVIAGWKRPDGTWLERYRPRVFSETGLSARTVADLREMMRVSVTRGWARTARLNPNNARPGVGGKTGSAEWSEVRDASHAWFIGFFPAEAPRLALAVVVERGGAGPTVAGRIARRVFAAEAVQRYARTESTR